MQIVLVRFAKSEDPLMEGHLLLEQYQAQYVAALRCVCGSVLSVKTTRHPVMCMIIEKPTGRVRPGLPRSC